MKMAIRNFFHIMTQGPPNPGFMQKKVQKGDFLKKDSRELKKKFSIPVRAFLENPLFALFTV